MAKSFNLTAELNLRGPANLKTVVADIKRQLGTVGGNIHVKIDPGAVKSIDGATRRIEALNSAIVKTRQNTNDLSASLRGLSSALGSVKSVGSVSAAGLKSTAESMNSAAKATQQATSRMEEFGKQSALAIKRFAAFSFVTTGIFALTNAITRGVKEFIEFDRQIVKLQQVTGKSRSGLTGLSDEITRLSTTLGVSSSSLIEVASTLAQAGLSAEDTKIALEALAKTELAPSFDDLTKTTEGAIAALRQFGLQTSQLESALGSINAVAAAFAVESSDIIAAIQRTGGVFAAASKGVSEGTDALNEFIAVFTSVRATTRESAETIATGLRTIFTRIQRAGTIEQLKAFGVELTDLEGKFVGPYEAVRRLSEALNQLDPRDIRFASIVEELGGFRQIGKVIPLIQQFATAQEALKVAQRGQDSLTAAQVIAQQSLANQLAKVREQFLALVRDIGQSSAFQNLFKIVTNLASGLISLVGAFKPILPLLSLLAVVKGVGAITKFGAGFAKGLGGKGAGETGRNIGETVSGTAAKERAEATSKAADAIRLNTDAIKNLTSSIQALDSTIKSRGSTGLNSGGKVLAFARGGVVPGTGNRDTVPAMLQPGEFVIRKKAVETIGSGNLQKINKYAQGGPIKLSLKNKPIGLSEVNDMQISNSAKGSIKGIMFERDFSEEYGVNVGGENIFPDVTDPGTVRRITKSNKAKGIELKYEDNQYTRQKYEQSLRKNDLTAEEIPLAVRKNSGGLIQKFADGLEVESIGKVSENILRRLEQLGGPGPIKQAVGLDFINATIRQKLAGKKITAKDLLSPRSLRSIPDSASLLPAIEPVLEKAEAQQKAKQTAKKEQIARNLQAAAGGAYQFGLASIYGPNGELGYSSVSDAKQIEGKDGEKYLTQIIRKSLPTRYAEAIKQTRAELAALPQRAGERLQYVDIFGTGGPLAFDFDETLVKGADIFDENGKIDIKAYNDLNRVKKALQNAELTLLGQELKSRLSEYPQLTEGIRVLTARPPSNTPYLADTLSRLRLPIPENKITGVSGGLNKVNNLSDLETLIDDNLENIQSVLGGGKKAIQYQESKALNLEDKSTGKSMAVMEGYALEEMVRSWGVNIAGDDADPNRPIDFPQGLGALSRYWDLPGSIPVDTKRTNSSDAVGRLFEEAQRFYVQNFKLGGQVYDLQKDTGLSDSEFDQLVKFGNTNDFTDSEFKDYLAKYLKNKQAKKNLMMNTGQLRDVLLSGTRTPEPTAKQLALAEQLKAYAQGGAAEDTVPALLTPGEFVINKKAAKKIGYSKLEKLNKADKLGIKGYNAGGFVGDGIQKFAEGGRLSKEERKRRKEQFLASQRGGVTRREAYETGMPRPDYGGPSPSADAIVKKAKIDKVFEDQVSRLMNDIRDQVTSQYQRLYDQERTSLKEYYTTKVANAIKEGKDTSAIVAEYKSAVADAKQALETGLKTAIQQRQAEVPNIIAERAQRDLTSYRESTGVVDTKPQEAKAKADRLAAEQATYFAYKAKQAGYTVEQYQRKLARETSQLAKDIRSNLTGKQQDLKFTSINLGADLKGRSRDGSDRDKTVIRQAEEVLIQKLKQLNPGKAFKDIEQAASRLVDKLIESGGSFDDIKDSIDLVKESMDQTPESVDAVNQAMGEMAQQTGINIDILNNQIRDQVEAGQTAFGAFRQNFNDVIQSLGGYIRVLGIGITLASDQITKLIISLDENSRQNAKLMSVLGGIQGGAQGMVAGQAIGSEGRRLLERLFPNSANLGRRFEVFSTALGTIIGAINGAADAYNRAKLDTVLSKVAESGKKVDAAFENLAKNNTVDAFNRAQRALVDSASGITDLLDQANFGAGGADRTRLEWMRGLDPTGITSSVTGQATETEAREQLFTAISEQVNRARQLGDVRMSRVSGADVAENVGKVQDIDRQLQEARRVNNEVEIKKLEAKRLELLSTTSQIFGQLRQIYKTNEDAFLALAMDQAKRSGTEKQFSESIKTEEGKAAAIEEGKRLSAMYAEQEQRSRLLADATRNVIIQTENLINIYSILDASLNRFSDAIDRIKNDAMDFADAYKGQASIKPVQRTDQDIFENIKAYSLDEVKGAAGRVSGLAGGGQVGADLERRIVGAKTIQEQLPKILAGITAQDSDKAVKQLKDAFKANKIEVDPAVFNELASKLQSELTGKREGATVAELAQDPAIMENLSKISEESLKAAANLSKTFYDTMDKAIAVTNEYSKALQEATEWQLKAADIRAKADIQLAEVLGENLSLDELNAPADARIRSLSTSSVLPGGSLDPDELYGAIQQLADQRESANAELQKRALAAASAQTDEERVRAREAVDEQVQLMAEQNAEINNTQKALEELANDSSRASNALKKLQDYRATTKAGVNLTQDILTADPKRLTEINKQLAAYNKTITGQATPQEMANVEFRQQAFGGLDMLKSVMPEKIAQQMQARMSRQMLSAMGVDLGQTIAIGPDNQAITLDQALTNVETGRDPQQEAYIEAYRQATERQAAAADRMSDAAIAVAINFQDAASAIIAMATTTTGINVPPAAAGIPALPQQLPEAVETAKPEPPKEEAPTEPKPSEPLVPPPPTGELPSLIDAMSAQSIESADKIVDAITALGAALAGATAVTLLERTLTNIFDSVISRITGNVVDAIGNRLFGGGAGGAGGAGGGGMLTGGLGLGQISAPFSGGAGVFGANVGGGAAGATLGTATAGGAAYGGYVLVDWITSVGELITDFDGKMQEVADFTANQDTKGYFAQVIGNLKEPGNAMIQLFQELGTLGSYAANTIGQQVGLVKDELAAADARLKELNAQAAGAGAVSFNKLDTTSQARVKFEADTRLQLKKAEEIKAAGGSASDVSEALGYNIGESIDQFIKIQEDKLEDFAKRSKGVRFYIPAVEEVMGLMESGDMARPSSPTAAKRATQTAATSAQVTNTPVSSGSQESAIATATSLKAEGKLDEALQVLREEARNVKKSEGEYSTSLIPINELAGEILAQKGDTASLAQLDKLKIKTQDIKDRTSQPSADTASVDAQTAQVTAQAVTISSNEKKPKTATEAKEGVKADVVSDMASGETTKATEDTASAAQTTADNSEISAKAAEQSITPGSIYTHDTHVEKVLYEILSVLSGKKAGVDTMDALSGQKVEATKVVSGDQKQASILPESLGIDLNNPLMSISEIVKKLQDIKLDSIMDIPDAIQAIAKNILPKADDGKAISLKAVLAKHAAYGGSILSGKKVETPKLQQTDISSNGGNPEQIPQEYKNRMNAIAGTKQTPAQRSPEQQKAIEDKAKADSAFAEKYKKEKPEYAATADEIAAGKSTLEAKSARGEKLSELQQYELEQGRRDEYFRRKNSGETNLDYDQMVYARQQRALDYENRQSQISSGGLRSYSTDPRDLPAQDPNALRIAKNDSRAREWLDKRKPNIPTPQSLQQQETLTTPRMQLPERNKKETLERLAELKKRGGYGIARPDGSPGRSYREQDEYMQLQEQTKTPYEQAKLARRQAYLSRFRPEVRERMLTKDEKAEQKFHETQTNIGTAPQQQQQIATYATSKQANPLEQLTTQFGSFIQNATSMIQSFMSGPVPVTKPQSSATQQQTTTTPNQIVQPLTVDPQATQFLDKLNTAFNSFGSYITSLEKVASNMPSKIDLVLVAEPIEVNVKLTGAAVIEELKRSPEAIKNIVDEQISATVGQKVQQISGWIKSVSGKDFSPGK